MIKLNRNKILSYFIFVIIATIFWISSILNKKSSYTKDIWIELVTPDSLLLLDSNLYKVGITLKGKGVDLIFEKRHHKTNPLLININRNSKAIYKEDIINALNNEIADLSINVVNISFTSKVLHLDTKISKTVPIIFKPDISYKNLFGLKYNINIKPKKVIISGPRSMLKDINEWNTEYKNYKEVNASINESISLEKPLSDKIYIQKNKVLVDISVEEYTEKKLILPIQIEGDSINEIEILPSFIEVSFLVGLSKYDQTKVRDFIATIFLNENLNKTSAFPVSIVKKPNMVKIQYIQPNYVDAYLKIKN